MTPALAAAPPLMAKARLARLVERYHHHPESKRMLARTLISVDLPCLGATSHVFELRKGVAQVERSAEHHVGRGKTDEISIDHGPWCMIIGHMEMD